MPSNEKELNCNLFDQLSIIEEAEEIAKEDLRIVFKYNCQITIGYHLLFQMNITGLDCN